MNYILADYQPEQFYPLTLTRPISALRVGMLTLREKWAHLLNSNQIGNFCEPYLASKFPYQLSTDNVLINSRVIPTADLAKAILRMVHNQAIVYQDQCIAIRIDASQLQEQQFPVNLENLIDSRTQVKTYDKSISFLNKLTDLFTQNHEFIAADFKLLTKGKKSDGVNKTNQVLGKNLFVKKGVKVSCSILNSETGPIYIDEGAEVMEGCLLRGPLYIGKGAVIKMGAKIYGATTIGPECRIGGEVSNSVMLGYSNKGHDGFMGNSILGEWCNLGADTNTSNLKNNYSEVKIWDFKLKNYQGTGLQFCGLLMGDHSKAAINTQFNTGTTVGVMANVFSAGFPEKYIPSFSWLGSDTAETFKLDKALTLAKEVMHRRHVDFTPADAAILTHLAENTNN